MNSYQNAAQIGTYPESIHAKTVCLHFEFNKLPLVSKLQGSVLGENLMP